MAARKYDSRREAAKSHQKHVQERVDLYDRLRRSGRNVPYSVSADAIGDTNIKDPMENMDVSMGDIDPAFLGPALDGYVFQSQ